MSAFSACVDQDGNLYYENIDRMFRSPLSNNIGKGTMPDTLEVVVIKDS